MKNRMRTKDIERLINGFLSLLRISNLIFSDLDNAIDSIPKKNLIW